MAFIEAKNLSRSFTTGLVTTEVLRGITLSIEKGEFVSIMGPSGSGKSTLMHILGFLDVPSSGDYVFDGKSIADYDEDDRAHVRSTRMGFVFQTFNLLPRTSVLENVKLPLLYSPIAEHEWDTRARGAIEAVGLTHRIEHDPSQLSGGERQRVAVARALVNKPDIILADEPTGNLDSVSGQQVMEMIEELNNRGHTVILVTHETYTAAYANRVIKLHDGQITEDRAVKKGHQHKLQK